MSRLIHGTLALLALAALLIVLPGSGARAQVADSARVGPTARVTATVDTTQPGRQLGPPISPRKALFQSLLIPGWGQASLDRNTAGALFVALEVTSIAMLVQSKKQLSIAREAARDSVLDTSTGTFVANPLAARVRPRKRAVEDWTALLIFSHLIAAADAFVAAHLWDVPIQVQGHEGTRSASISTSIPF
ncbi:MAG TPA: DUF5683 domain-containing protein [Gemmatimonadaceae bacterium]|nr:DUF5683 domain-containing protein [Gemmatimonadaceae bacterium]